MNMKYAIIRKGTLRAEKDEQLRRVRHDGINFYGKNELK